MTRRRTALDFQRDGGRAAQRVRNMIRRMVVAVTDAVTWSLTGHSDESGQAERADAHVFSGIGFAARPRAEGAAEAIVVTVEASTNRQVIVATRDESAERAIVELAGLDLGETLIFNTAGARCMIKLTKDGDVLIGAPTGNGAADFQAVALADHTHAAPAITGQAQYVDPDARTGPPDQVSAHVKVT